MELFGSCYIDSFILYICANGVNTYRGMYVIGVRWLRNYRKSGSASSGRVALKLRTGGSKWCGIFRNLISIQNSAEMWSFLLYGTHVCGLTSIGANAVFFAERKYWKPAGFPFGNQLIPVMLSSFTHNRHLW